MNFQLLLKRKNQGLMILLMVATAITAGIAIYGIKNFGQLGEKQAGEIVETPVVPQQVSALGRLEPASELIRISAPLALDGDRILELPVKEGDRLKKGDIIAILQSKTNLESALLQARKQVKVAQAKLAQIKAGAKLGEIKAQAASVDRIKAQYTGDKKTQVENIKRLELQWESDKIAQQATIDKIAAELKNAQGEYERYQKLFNEGAISSSIIESKGLIVETTKQQLNEAKAMLSKINSTAKKEISKARIELSRIDNTSNKQVKEAEETLTSIAEIRPVDVELAQSEVESAIANLKRAKIELAGAYIRAPMDGTIIKIHHRPGEKITASGIVDFAQTDKMIAVAEVYQTDISKVKIGQKALITSQGFTGKLQGTVQEISLLVSRQNVFSDKPGENLDSRVVEVKILINPEDSKKVSGLTNLQVQTVIQL